MKYNDIEDNLMRYLKDTIPFRSFLSFFCVLLLTSLIVVYEYDNISNVLLPNSLSRISKIAQTAAAISTTTSDSRFDSHGTAATITDVQFPGIVPNNNNTNPPTTSPKSPPASPSTLTLPPIIQNSRARPALGGPTLNDPNLKVEQIINRGFDDPTSMAFLGPNDILVLEKNTGKVHRILNGKILPEPVLDVSVANQAERGLLGIAIAKSNNNGNTAVVPNTTNATNIRVFLYYTESGEEEMMMTNQILKVFLPLTQIILLVQVQVLVD